VQVTTGLIGKVNDFCCDVVSNDPEDQDLNLQFYIPLKASDLAWGYDFD